MKSATLATERVFGAVCIVFSLAMLLAALVCRAGIMRTESQIQKLYSDIAIAEKQLNINRVRFENRLSLQELERIATEELGMHKATAQQIFFCTPAG